MAPTIRNRVCIFVGPPGVEALMVIGDVPNGVPADVPTVKETLTGFPAVGVTVFDLGNWQLAPCGRPEHEIVTAPLKPPRDDTSRETGFVMLPGVTLTLDGTGVPRL
jgi:hypothetical protein